MKIFYYLFFFLFFLAGSETQAANSNVKIIYPTEGAVINAGKTIKVEWSAENIIAATAKFKICYLNNPNC